MRNPPPLRPIRIHAKQLHTANNSAAEIAMLDLAFPLFNQLDDEFRSPDGTWAPVQTGFGGKIVYIGRGRERRYAGDRALERGRYWSVCDDDRGDDRGTLINELRAYHSFLSRAHVYVVDTIAQRDEFEALSTKGIDLERLRDIARYRSGSPEAAFVLLSFIPMFETPRAATLSLRLGSRYLNVFGLRREEIDRRSVFDLRRADARAWLLNSFLPLELEYAERLDRKMGRTVTGRQAPQSEQDLLPVLLAPELGGGIPFVQGLGAWLRSNGCDGIIFPSARSDVHALEAGGRLLTSSGWNFVDFKGAPPADWEVHLGQVLSFSVYLGSEIGLSVSGSPDRGEVRVTGLARQNKMRFNCMSHHAEHGTYPNLQDLAAGYTSILDMAPSVLQAIKEQEGAG